MNWCGGELGYDKLSAKNDEYPRRVGTQPSSPFCRPLHNFISLCVCVCVCVCVTSTLINSHTVDTAAHAAHLPTPRLTKVRRCIVEVKHRFLFKYPVGRALSNYSLQLLVVAQTQCHLEYFINLWGRGTEKITRLGAS